MDHDYPRGAGRARRVALYAIEQTCDRHQPEDADPDRPADGARRPAHAQGSSRGAAKGRVQDHRTGSHAQRRVLRRMAVGVGQSAESRFGATEVRQQGKESGDLSLPRDAGPRSAGWRPAAHRPGSEATNDLCLSRSCVKNRSCPGSLFANDFRTDPFLLDERAMQIPVTRTHVSTKTIALDQQRNCWAGWVSQFHGAFSAHPSMPKTYTGH